MKDAMTPGPLETLSQWDDAVAERYKQGKEQESFRQYDDSTPPGVREFYRLNHTHQTRDFVLAKKKEYGPSPTARWASGRPWTS